MVQPISANKALERDIKATSKRLVQDNNSSQQDILLSNFVFLLTMSLETNGEILPHGMDKTNRMMYFEEKYSNLSNVCTKQMYSVLSQSKKKWESLSWHLEKSL